MFFRFDTEYLPYYNQPVEWPTEEEEPARDFIWIEWTYWIFGEAILPTSMRLCESHEPALYIPKSFAFGTSNF